MERSAYEKGVDGEKQAADFLSEQGYRILEHRLRTPYGEIDLLAQQENIIVFIEVKYRRTIDEAAYALKKTQQARLIRAALWLQGEQYHPVEKADLRFDVLLLSSKKRITHIKNAFSLDSLDFTIE